MPGCPHKLVETINSQESLKNSSSPLIILKTMKNVGRVVAGIRLTIKPQPITFKRRKE
jgi:hypothetical protein